MKLPEFIKKGSTIGLVAPSFGANIEPYKTRLKSAINYLKQEGYNVKIFGEIFGYEFGASETKEKRAKHFMNCYLDDEVDLVWSVSGGQLMIEILPLLDFKKLKKAKPKFFVGYSDNTNLTFTLNTILNTISVYAPCLTTYGMKPLDDTLKNTFKLLQGEAVTQYASTYYEPEDVAEKSPTAPYSLTKKTKWFNLNNENKIHLKGRLIGGCLDILETHVGTSFDYTKEYINKYKDDSIIWFLEAAEMDMFSYKRALWKLKHAGWFNHAKGIVFGRTFSAKDILDLNLYNVTKDVLNELNIPIIMDIDIGHTNPMMTFFSGAKVEILNDDKKSFVKFDL